MVWLSVHWGSFPFSLRAPSENGEAFVENEPLELFVQLCKQVQLLLMKAVLPHADLKYYVLYVESV